MLNTSHFGGTAFVWARHTDNEIRVSINNHAVWARHEEIEEERRWDASFARSQDLLKRLGDMALADFLAGDTEPLDPDKL
jgi:hypothetical protein